MRTSSLLKLSPEPPVRKTNRYMLGVMGAASLLVHVGGVIGLGWLALHSFTAAPRATYEIASRPGSARAVDIPLIGEGATFVEREPDRTGDEVHPAGGNTVARIDTRSAGAGGERTVDAPALNLAARDEQLRMSPDSVSRLDRDQVQRIRTGRDRSSYEDRRSTTHPTELTFLASGSGHHAERRAVAAANPSRGARAARAAEVRGGEVGAPAPEADGAFARHRAGMLREGSRGSSPGLGVAEGRVGVDHRASAAVAFARPDVAEGPVATPAILKGRSRDAEESDQEVATMVRSLVHASTAGGAVGQGRGGSGGGGDPGAGAAAGRGSRARALGGGEGDFLDFDTNDPRLMPYFRHLHARINPLWKDAFPRDALADLKQGMVILEFTIHADGSVNVSWPPVRPSGIEEFDRKCADAIRRAGPFDPLPPSLGRTTLAIRAPFDARNPVIR